LAFKCQGGALRRFTRISRAAALFAAAFGFHAVPANAQLAVEPLFVEVAPGQSAAIRARNTSDKPMTLELEIDARHVSRDGVQTRTSADDEFVALPPQAVVPAQGTQVFRVQALPTGEAQSKSYFITVHQLPVKMDELEGGGAQLQMVFAFDVAVHVVPSGAEAKPELLGAALSTTMVEEKKDANASANSAKSATPQVQVPAVQITLRNTGTKYLYLQNFEYVATGMDASGAKVDLARWQENEIVNAAGVTLVEPGAERVFKLPLRNAPALKSVQVEIRNRPKL
jgi:fimbrial chaperone protein